MPAKEELQPAHPGLQHFQVLVEGADDAVLATFPVLAKYDRRADRTPKLDDAKK